MKRLTYELGQKGSGHYDTDNSKDMPINMWIACINKLGKLEDLEEEIGISLETILNYIKNGYTDKTGKYHKQCYLTYVDNEWCICDLITDEYFLLKEMLK